MMQGGRNTMGAELVVKKGNLRVVRGKVDRQ